MEKFFLKLWTIKVETWQVALVLIVAMLGVIGFGAAVEKAATSRGSAGIAGLALKIARIPAESSHVVNQLLLDHRPTLARQQRFEGESGFKRFKNGDDEALLLARFDGDENRSVVEIMDLDNGAILHRYAPDIRALNAMSKETPVEAGPNAYRIGHPYLTEDGGLIFHGFTSPLYKIDVCSNIIWTIDRLFHHSLEKDAGGNFWAASWFRPPTTPYTPPDGRDPTIVQISPDGKILFEKSIHQILIENSLQHMVYPGGRYTRDPTHLNDVQPAMFDGPYWRRGDLFVSLRNRSTVLLYRPSTNKVLWVHNGPWMMQHDVDIISDHQIAVFNNNAAGFEWGAGVLGNNDTIIYDFATEELKSPFSEGYKDNEIRTPTEGRSEILADGELFVEESNYGRLLKMSAAGDLTWQYVNRASDGRLYVVNWSRYIDAELADKTAALAKQKCTN